MIDNDALKNILTTATDISVVVEIYASDATPTADGFDPVDAIGCFASVDGISFRDITYTRLVRSIGSLKRTITSEVNTCAVTFDNLTRQISDFEFQNGFEGLILVVRLISRSLSVELTDSQILFVGRCDKPTSGKRESLSVTAKFILGGADVTIPRRKFGPEDQDGRVTTDPEFEGFIFMPQYGTSSYSTREKRGGLLGLFGFHKTVWHTLQYSSFSDLDSNKSVPEVLGRAQMLGTHIAYIDSGSLIKIRTAFCEGEIEDIVNARSTNSLMPLSGTGYTELYGKVGTNNGPDDATWPGPGYYSRTSYIRSEVTNSDVSVVEAAPDIAAVILGRKMPTPDADGNWTTTIWTDNAAAHVRFLFTNPNYYNLHTNWLDDADFSEAWDFNNELIFDRSASDFIFVG